MKLLILNTMYKKMKNITFVKLVLFLVTLLFPATIMLGQDEYIAISKRGPANALPGDLITYTLTVGNGDQSVWTGTIIDTLPDEFTYYSSNPVATTVVGQILTWTNFTVQPEENREITITGYAGRLGSTFGTPHYANDYYMGASGTTPITNDVRLENGTSGLPLSDDYTTDVYQLVDFYLINGIGTIKMSTGATMRYLVVLQNTGNVWDRYTLYTDPNNAEFADCEDPWWISDNPNVVLENELLGLDGNPIPGNLTPWIAPGETYAFYLQLTTPNGTPANRWNCTEVIAVSEIREDVIKAETFHTATIHAPPNPDLNVYNIDYPDPVACQDTLNYTIYIVNMGGESSYNTTVTNIYDPFFEFISSDPPPLAGYDNIWNVGLIAEDDVARIDIQGRILGGVLDQEPIIDSVIVNYEDGALPPAQFADTVETTTLVNAFPDLAIGKAADAAFVRLTDTITYTIDYSNIGCGSATGVVIEDDFDELRTVVVDAGGGTVIGGVLHFDIGTLSPEDGVQTLEYSLMVADVGCGAVQIENDVTISSSGPDAYVLNNSASTSVLAVTAPTWVRFPADTTVECDNVPDPAVWGNTEGGVYAEDACGSEVSYTFDETPTAGDCDNSYTLTRTWTAEDDYGNSTVRSQLITVIDTTAPVITCPLFSGYETTVDGTGHVIVTLEANSGDNYLVAGDDFNPTVLDNCDAAPGLTYTLAGSTTGTGSDLDGITFNTGTTTVDWMAADDCGNVDDCGYTVIVNAEPSILLEKTLEDIDGDPAATTYVTAGSELNYSFTISNTGNMVLYDVTVLDPLATVTGTTISELAPGEVDDTSFTATYIVTQDDLDGGSFTNIATVSGTAINTALASDSDTLTVNATQNAILDVTKTSTTDPNTFSDVGDELTYQIVVENAGNVTLTAITVEDPLTGGNWSIPTLDPGDSETYTTSYLVDQGDLDLGHVVNTATAEGTDPDAAPVTASDNETVNANQLFTLDVTKTIDKVDYVYAGDTITYSIVLENIGNVNLLNIAVEDSLDASTTFIDANPTGSYNTTNRTISWAITQLSPAEVVTYIIRVVVNHDVENEAEITNMATTESAQTFLVESNQTAVTAIQLPELELVSVTPVDCYGEATGSISVDVTGGLAPYTYTWSHDVSETGSDISGLAAGTYTVTVEDALGNTDELSVSVEQPAAPLTVALSTTDVACHGESTGAIELDVSGGTSPYTFLWSNLETTQDIDELPADTFSVVVTDANGCTWTGDTIIEEPEDPMSIFNVIIDDEDVVCKDDAEGSISFEISGGTPPYTYLWSSGETTMDLTNIKGGDYTVTVTDANGCEVSEDFEVEYDEETCTIEIPGGITPYGEFDRTLIINGLAKYPENSLKIFNRYGTMVFEAGPYGNDWGGEPNLNMSMSEADGKLPSGTYFYILILEPGGKTYSGYIYLIKE